MPEPTFRIAPRSAGAGADTLLLRVARTDIAPPAGAAGGSLVARLRSRLLPRRLAR